MHEMDILMSFVLQKPKEFIYAHPQYQLTAKQVRQFTALVKRREAGEPIAYLTGHKEFYGLDFLVDKRVLIPRPSTELIIELVTQSAKAAVTILDVGTGSGNIAVTLKHVLPNAKVYASDVSIGALAVAKQNSKHLNAPVKFYKSNVLKQLPKTLHGKIDILTFNAPYLTKQEAGKQNLKYEPQVALTPTGAPTSLIERLLQQAGTFLTPHGKLYLEIGHRQAKQVTKLCLQYFPNATVITHQDLGGWDRVIELNQI